MGVWSQLYETQTVLNRDCGHERIFAPAAYKIVRTLPIVPIIHTEALDLSTHFPVCWSVAGNEPTLCVLRSLLGATDPRFSFPKGASLPKVFQAYPIIVPPAGGAGQQRIVYDSGIADQPTDIGAPLLTADSGLSRATAMRARIALEISRETSNTQALSRFLLEADLLEPWPLHFDLGNGERVDIEHLMVLSRARLGQPEIYQAIHKFGASAALFMSAQRLSLFRISALLAAAKTAVASSSQPNQAA